MSHTIPIQQTANSLAQLISALRPGDEIVLTDHDKPIARILPIEKKTSRRKRGSCKGMLVIHQEDEAHLDGFAEYMP